MTRLTYPSLFVVSIQYKNNLAQIDITMKEHMLFLRRQYKSGVFLVSGRKVPRTGGIIIARAADKKSIHRIMQLDPFIQNGLATFRVTEFLASQQSEEIKHWLQP